MFDTEKGMSSMKVPNSFDAELCKQNALAFFRAACMIEKDPRYMEFKYEMISPYTMNLMFACELYLKWLIFEITKDIPRTIKHRHKVFDLYNELKSCDILLANKIEDLYNRNSEGLTINSIDFVLEICNDNFENFRYMHEKTIDLVMYSTDMAAFVRILKRVSEEK